MPLVRLARAHYIVARPLPEMLVYRSLSPLQSFEVVVLRAKIRSSYPQSAVEVVKQKKKASSKRARVYHLNAGLYLRSASSCGCWRQRLRLSMDVSQTTVSTEPPLVVHYHHTHLHALHTCKAHIFFV